MAYSKQNFQDGQILNAANLETMENGIIAGQGAHNLLDNSDFRDPVNHRGASEYSGYFSYTIDRWFIPTSHVSVTIQSGSIKATTSGNAYASISQKIASATRYAGKTLTLAAYVQSNVAPRIIVYNGNTSIASKEGTSGSYQLLVCNFTVPANIADGALSISIESKSTQAGNYVEAQWAALYEGSYTADTLPAYVPKGKHVEMLNCNVPLAPRNLLDNSDFRNPVNQLGRSGKYEGVSDFYTFVIDRWKTYSTECTYTLSSTGLQIANLNPDSPAGPYEELSNPKQMTGKTYTLAVGYSGGNVVCGNVAVPTGMLTEDKHLSVVSASGTRPGVFFHIKSDYSLIVFQILIPVGKTITVEWAALYEGSYTADTLPPYVPKGKHVEMLNCKVPLTPHNLLDNSDFTNPVNQRGKTSYTNARDTIDRWKLSANTLNVDSDGITLVAGNSSPAALTQYIRDLRDGTYTQALNVNGTIYTRIIQLSGSTITTIDSSNATYTGGYVSCSVSNSGDYSFNFRANPKYSITVRWAALYEGAYTVDTLPSYVPKGKHIEMLNCGVPFAPHNLLDNSDFTNPVNQRGVTSEVYNQKFIIDKWMCSNVSSDAPISVNTNGITLNNTAGTNTQGIEQYISIKDGTYTVAAKTNSSILIRTFTYSNKTITDISSSSDGKGEIDVGLHYDNIHIYIAIQAFAGYSIKVEWAALYEGAYTADTLPPYVPKGKHVEMLNCGVPLAPHNLLDNSDFGNPIAQAGLNGMHGSTKYVCDRWVSEDANATFGRNFIRPGSPIEQRLSKTVIDINKTYTAAFCYADGKIKVESGTFSNGFGSDALGIYCIKQSDAFNYVTVRLNRGNEIHWAALYEGSYDASTLPAYQPKGYAAELAECQRYYENSWFDVGKTDTQEYIANVWSSAQADAKIEFKQQKRIPPTITFYPIGTESNWRIFNGSYQSINSVENKGRGGFSGFIARVTKGSSDGTTWTVGYTIQAQGHWEASADL